MRYSTGITATRTRPARLSINVPPSPKFPAELHVDFGGMSAWFSEAEATALGQQLIEAGIRMRALAADVENTKEGT